MTQITPLFLGQMDIVRTPKEENVIVTQKIFPRARRGQPGRSASEANLLAAEVSDDDDDIYIMMKCLSVCVCVTKNHHFPLPS